MKILRIIVRFGIRLLPTPDFSLYGQARKYVHSPNYHRFYHGIVRWTYGPNIIPIRTDWDDIPF